MRNYIKAARLRTLPLSVSGIIVGASIGFTEVLKSSAIENLQTTTPNTNLLQSSIFWLATLTTIGFQVLSNFANDYGDGIKGTDDNRKGEARMVSSGAISPNQMKRAIVVTSIISIVTAILLIYEAFGEENFGYSMLFLILGLISIVAAIKYTIGEFSYGYSGFGDLFVFLFFGLLAVVGTYFLYVKQLTYIVFFPAFTIGLLSTAVLNLNNMRDRVSDKNSGKNTLVVKIGSEFAKYYHYYLIASSFLFTFLYSFLQYRSPYQFLFMVAYVPLIKHVLFVMKNKEEAKLDGELKKVALSTFLFAILFSVGLFL